MVLVSVAMLIPTEVYAQSDGTNDLLSPSFRIEEVDHVEGPQLAKYCVVIGSFSLQVNAEGLRDKLNNAGLNATIVKNKSKSMYRVIGISSNDLQEANNLKQQINKSYPYSWLLCLDGYNYIDNGDPDYYANNKNALPVVGTVNQQNAMVQVKSQQNPVVQVKRPLSPVDKDIPTIDYVDRNTFAIIIGNEKYKNVAEVPFAQNDAKIFSEYVQKNK